VIVPYCHAFDQRGHPVVPRDIGGGGEVDEADGGKQKVTPVTRSSARPSASGGTV